LHRQVGRLFALENAAGVDALSLTVPARVARGSSNQITPASPLRASRMVRILSAPS
jgi:hypothetical protein